MTKRWIALIGVLAFAITMAIVLGNRLSGSGAEVLALGVSIGVVAGIIAGALVAWLGILRGGTLTRTAQEKTRESTTVVLPAEQADKLLKILSSREQASPSDFPMIANGERRFSVVGGATLDDEYED